MGSAPTTQQKETGVYYSHDDLAGLLRRSFVLAVDLAIVLSVWGVLLGFATSSVISLQIANGVAFLLAWAYLAGLKSGEGNTLGYRLAGVKLVNLEGEPAGLFKSTCRFLFLFVGPLNFVFDLLWLTSDANKQTLRDKLTRTYVVDRNAVPAGRAPIIYSQYFIATMSFVLPEVQRPAAESAVT
jgi:uncharacterized RDD family membrane protein YckC